MKFRNQSIVVEAEQWFPDTAMPDVVTRVNPRSDIDGPFGYLNTRDGWALVRPGDWVITGVRGEKYAVNDARFADTYEPIEDEA